MIVSYARASGPLPPSVAPNCKYCPCPPPPDRLSAAPNRRNRTTRIGDRAMTPRHSGGPSAQPLARRLAFRPKVLSLEDGSLPSVTNPLEPGTATDSTPPATDPAPPAPPATVAAPFVAVGA